jgi:hypothetical protein
MDGSPSEAGAEAASDAGSDTAPDATADAAVSDARQESEGSTDAGGALAYYSFNNEADPAHDDTGNLHDGTLQGAAWTDAGRFGGAVQFAAAPDGGVDDWIVVSPFPQPQTLGGSWSVSLWLMVQSADFSGGYISVLSTEIAMAGGWEVDILPPNAADPTFANLQFAFWVPSAGTYSTATCACLAFGSWTHFVAVVDGAALTIALYEDGLAAVPSTPALGPFATGLPHLFMGRWGSTGRQLVGVLDEVALFDRTLSATEVRQLYLGTLP